MSARPAHSSANRTGRCRGRLFASCCVVGLSMAPMVSCSGDPLFTTASTTPVVTLPDAGLRPRVDLISVAIEALEVEFGGPQRYFEINATSGVVNLFVALNNGAIVQPWVYLDGQLSSQEGQPAQGNSFDAAAIEFDPDTVLETIAKQLSGSVLTVFAIEGGKGGIVQYSVIIDSASGGQLLAILGPSGQVLSVDPQ